MRESILEPLADRYLRSVESATGDVTGAAQDPASVRVMPLVLRLERGTQPQWSQVLEAAATASLAVCMDPRAAPDGPWYSALHRWTSGRIRKVARRARGSHWRAVQQLPGVTSTVGDAEVRALVPMRMADTPKEVTRLQISGATVSADRPRAVSADVPLLLRNPAVAMTVGKAAAQVGHATMLLAALLDDRGRRAWADDAYGCAVRSASTCEWQRLLPGADPARAWHEHGVVAVRDAGFTEIAPGTITVLGLWRSQ